MTDKGVKTHHLERTSPKGGPFVGYCVYCGQDKLTFMNSRDLCPALKDDYVSQEDDLIRAIKGPGADA